MKNLSALLVALLLVPACGSDREQSPGPNAPASTTTMAETIHDTATTTTATETTTTGTQTGTATGTSTQTGPKTSLLDMERDALRTMVQAFDAHDVRKVEALYAPNARMSGVDNGTWMEVTGTSGIETGMNKLFTAFPDMRFASTRAYLSGNVAIQEWVATGTHRGDYESTKATGKSVGLNGASVFWFDDQGRITQEHTYCDSPAINLQIGARKGKTRAVPTLPQGDTMFIVGSGTADDNRWVNAAKALYQAYGNDEQSFLGGLAKDATLVEYRMLDDRKGTNGWREHYRVSVKAFPDLRVTPVNVWGFGSRVVAETALSGTWAAAYGSYKATQKPLMLHSLDVLRFDEDGKIVEITRYGSSGELTPPESTGTSSQGLSGTSTQTKPTDRR